LEHQESATLIFRLQLKRPKDDIISAEYEFVGIGSNTTSGDRYEKHTLKQKI